MTQKSESLAQEIPYLSRALALTQAFYAWERRGRGWQVWPEPIEIEPPFVPFHLRPLPGAGPVDDGRRTTFLSRLLDGLLGRGKTSPCPCPEDTEEIEEPEPAAFCFERDLAEIQLALPQDGKVTLHAAQGLLLSLGACTWPVAFEVVGTGHEIVVQFACDQSERHFIREQLQVAFPGAVLRETFGHLAAQLQPTSPKDEIASVDFGLLQECMRPLRVPDKWNDADPLASVAAALATLRQGEAAVLQILFTPARAPWTEHMRRAVTNWNGESFFTDAPDMVKLAERKTERPIFAAVVRAAARSATAGRAADIIRGLGGTLSQFADPASNELVPLEDDEYDPDQRVQDIADRQTRRSGMLLNTEELAGLVHPPAPSVQVSRLRRDDGRTRAAPAAVIGHTFVLGENRHLGQTILVSVAPEVRRRHMHVIGATGTGKSTLLLNLIVQDMESGEGLAVFDPHGDLIDDVLRRMPESRLKDVVLVDPSDMESPVGCNVLYAHSELEKTLIASDLVGVFKRLSTTWGDQMTTVLGNAVLAILESDRGGTLVDVRRMLVESDFRESFLDSVADPDVVYYWRREYPLLTGRPQAPVLTRLDALLRPKPIRAMVSAHDRTLDFADVMDKGRIFLAKLSQGLIGEENASLLGALFVGKFHQLALARQARGQSDRRPFHIYLDEFHNFATPTLSTLLSGGRKYGLGLVLAHQETRQIAQQDPSLLSAVLANTATRICFRVGDEDARKLEDGFANFSARDLQNLSVGQAIGRVERADADFSLTTLLPMPLPTSAQSTYDRAVAMSRERYGQRLVLVPPKATSTPPAVREVSASAALGESDKTGVVRPPSPVATTPIAVSRPSPGRGGAQHKYLQELIKRWAEANGWRVSVEKSVLDGLGSVDVALERDDVSVACEIGIASPAESEIRNIQKCLSAGFQFVVAIVLEPRKLAKMTEALTSQLGESASRVMVTSPEGLFDFLAGLAPSKAQTVRGYKVSVSRRPGAKGAGSARTKTVAETMLGALKRLKSK